MLRSIFSFLSSHSYFFTSAENRNSNRISIVPTNTFLDTTQIDLKTKISDNIKSISYYGLSQLVLAYKALDQKIPVLMHGLLVQASIKSENLRSLNELLIDELVLNDDDIISIFQILNSTSFSQIHSAFLTAPTIKTVGFLIH